MNDCEIHMDGGIIDIGTRYAVYGTALLTIALGGLAMFSVNRSMIEASATSDDEMYSSIRAHKKNIRPVSTTLNLTGIAMVCAAVALQSSTVQTEAQAAQEINSNNNQGPFTLFHAYTLLSLLWLITLTGMMIHVHTWVFNVIRRQRGSLNGDKRRFINSIWNGTHWYLLQVELMGIYGYYVCTNRDAFPPTTCRISVFDNAGFRTFAKIVYVIAMIPIVNVGLLCAALVGSVWLMSLVATYLSSHSNNGKVSATIFHFFWFMTCLSIVFAIGVTTEVLLFTNTNSQNLWTFGSLLALILLVIPAETFIGELYLLMAPDALRNSVKQNLGTHRPDYVKTWADGADESLLPSPESPTPMPVPHPTR